MSGTNFRGGRKPFPKPSAFESEIHPTHKPSVYAPGISPCRGQICASANLQFERAGLNLSMPFQRTGRMDAIAANGYILGQIRINIYGTSQKSPWLSKSNSREPPGYGHGFAISRLIAATHRESGGIRLSAQGKEKGICEKKFIYRNGEAP